MKCCMKQQTNKLPVVAAHLGKQKQQSSQQKPRYPVRLVYPKGTTDLSNLRISNQQNKYFLRAHGSVNNSELRLEDLTNCMVILLDGVKAITIDNCKNCSFVLCACSGSIFMRDCENCKVAAISQQMRLRNCKQCCYYIHCKTDPIIEVSSNIQFGPFMFTLSTTCFSQELVEDLSRQIERVTAYTEIDFDCNKYDCVYDFSPSPGNFTTIRVPSVNQQLPQQPPVIFWYPENTPVGVENVTELKSNYTSNFGVPTFTNNQITGAEVIMNCQQVPPLLFNFELNQINGFVTKVQKTNENLYLTIKGDEGIKQVVEKWKGIMLQLKLESESGKKKVTENVKSEEYKKVAEVEKVSLVNVAVEEKDEKIIKEEVLDEAD
ncbi:Tubulin_binding cofactor C [Hexamita inflata]|uniref:Tubulin binding cofactor C n=1 Tax=Hexamita inflata TaxID=28002 RepID=A0AA86UIF3_9EUKA|nr:Tubulin binding cofactor C [Hexamita inflata]